MAFGISAATWLAGAATVGGALINKKGASKAADAQADAGKQASADAMAAQQSAQAFQQKQFDQARSDQEPWRVAGGNALAQLSQRTAPGGDLMRNFGMADFQADPGYAFRQAEGMKGLTNSAAARGGLLSGAALKASSRYNQDIASNEFSNAYSRFNTNRDGQYNKLADLSGIGQRVSTQNGTNAMQLGQNVSSGMMNTAQNNGNNLMGAANARASSYMGQANTWGNALNQGVSMWNNRNNGGTPNAQNVIPTFG